MATAAINFEGDHKVGAASGTDTTLTKPIMLVLFLFALSQPYMLYLGDTILPPYRLLLLFLLIPLGISWLKGGMGRFMITDFLIIAHLAWMPICMIANLGSGLNNFGRMPAYIGTHTIDLFGAYLLGRATVRTPQDMIFMTKCLLGVLLLLLPFALIESLTGNMILRELGNMVPYGRGHVPNTLNYEPRLGMLRAQTSLPHPILYGVVSGTAFSLGWLVLRHTKPSTPIPARLIWLAGSLGGTFLALSAGAWITVIVQIGFISYNRIFRGIEKRWLILLWGFAAFYMFLVFYSERPPFVVLSRLIALNPGTAWFRFMIYEYGSAEVMRHPIFGMGVFTDYIRAWWMDTASLDNHWLLMAMRWGFPGFFMLLAIAFLPLIKLSRRNYNGNKMLSDMRYALIFSLLALYISIATVALWGYAYAMMFFLIGCCCWLIDVDESAQAEDSSDAAKPETLTSRYTRFPNGNKPSQSNTRTSARSNTRRR